MFSEEQGDSEDVQPNVDEVPMEVDLDEMMTLPLSKLPLVSAMHVHIFFTTFYQLLKHMGPGHFLKSIFVLQIWMKSLALRGMMGMIHFSLPNQLLKTLTTVKVCY